MTSCKVCASPNRPLYEERRVIDKYSFNGLSSLSKELGDSISPVTFSKHFKNKHLTLEKEKMIRRGIHKPMEVRPSKLKQKLMSSYEIVERLESDLLSIQQLTRKAMNTLNIQDATLNLSTVRVVTTLMKTSTEMINSLPKLKGQLQIQGSIEPEDMINDISRLFAKVALSDEQIMQLDEGLKELIDSWGIGVE